jgi:hypothetical protein
MNKNKFSLIIDNISKVAIVRNLFILQFVNLMICALYSALFIRPSQIKTLIGFDSFGSFSLSHWSYKYTFVAMALVMFIGNIFISSQLSKKSSSLNIFYASITSIIALHNTIILIVINSKINGI